MSDKVGRIIPGGSIPPALRPTTSAEASPIDPVHVVDGPDIRLLVEEPEPGRLVYVLVDARTGKVLSRLTGEHLDRMAQDPAYIKGSVIDRKA